MVEASTYFQLHTIPYRIFMVRVKEDSNPSWAEVFKGPWLYITLQNLP